MPNPIISDLRTVLLRFPLPRPIVAPFGRLDARHNLIVIAQTDGGAQGLGEIWANFPFWGCTEKVALFEQVVRPLLVGEILDDPARLYALMQDKLRLLALQWGAKGPVQQVIAGVDAALWDAFARTKGVPLRDLLAGQPTAAYYPVYASGLSCDDTAGQIEEARAQGHRRYKVRISFGPDKDPATLAAARGAAGDEPIMADANQTLTPTSLLALKDPIEAARLDWLEEPFPVDDLAAYDDFPYGIDVPLALGENSYGRAELADVTARWNPGVVQPDITKCGGVSEGIVFARDAVGQGRRLCLHNFGGAVGLYVSANVMAAVDGADWLEMDANPNPSFDHALTITPTVRDGLLELPEGPGLGIELNEDALAKWRVGGNT
ncbi:MAG: mandelate racemase/muconate lactonizing enzyme family protein [Rhodospirillales bacterium]|nr:mandelate racemase/muconate lactonizing enzyme family protein [Rhodospirillales bacterium]